MWVYLDEEKTFTTNIHLQKTIYITKYIYTLKICMYLIFLSSFSINFKAIIQRNGFHYTFPTPHTVPVFLTDSVSSLNAPIFSFYDIYAHPKLPSLPPVYYCLPNLMTYTQIHISMHI